MPPHRHRVPVLIFGGQITALGVLRDCSKRKLRCYVVDETSDLIIRSRWYRALDQRLAETDDSSVLASYLESLPLREAVLIPCSDRWTLAVAGLPSDLRERFRASVPAVETLRTFIQKEQFDAVVDRLGIPHPKSTLLRTEDDLATVSDAELRGGFLKPTESHAFHRAYGTKGSFVRSRADASRWVRNASSAGLTLMLQEWIPGPMRNSVIVDGFRDRDGNVVSMVARRRLRMDPPRIANTASCQTIPLSDVREAVDATRRLVDAVGYRGVFSVEWKQDPRDQHFKIIELNARPFWYTALTAAAGVDLAWMSYLDALGEVVPDPGPYRTGLYGMYEIPEIAALVRAWTHGRRPEGPVLVPWLRGHHVLLQASDPMPGVYDLASAVKRRVLAAARR